MCPASPRTAERGETTSCRPTRRRSGPRPRPSRPSARRRRARTLSRRRRACARSGRSPSAMGSIRPADRRQRLGRSARPDRLKLRQARRRGHLQPAWLPGLPDRHPRGRRHAGGGARARPHRRRRRDAGRRHRAHPASSSSPTRTTRPAPICRAARCAGCTPACPPTCCWCSTRPMPNTSRANDYDAGPRTRRRSRQRRDDAGPSRRSTASPACGSAGSMRRPHVCDALNRIRGPFNVNGAGAGGRHRGDRRSPPMSTRAVAHNDTLAALADARTRARSAST